MSASSMTQAKFEARAVLRQSFVWMTTGLIITPMTAWLGSQSDVITRLVTTQPVAVVGLIAWLVLAIGFTWIVQRIPYYDHH